jgi:FkbM family methyltransferase
VFKKAFTALRILRESPHPWQALRSRWRYNLLVRRLAWAPMGWFTYRSRQKVTFLVDAQDPATFFIYADGHPDTAELNTLSSWLESGDACLDLGANIGFFTAVLANRVGPMGLVVAVEAAPATFGSLCRAVDRLGLTQVRPVNACAGDRPGTIDFHAATNPHDSPLQSVHDDEARPGAFHSVTVPLMRPETMAASLAPAHAIALVKMDVEGSELAALAGCAGLVESENPPLFDIEINPSALARGGARPTDILRLFPSSHYELLFISYAHGPHPWPRNRLLVLTTCTGVGLPDLGNLIAVPRIGRFAQRRVRLGSAVPIAFPLSA